MYIQEYSIDGTRKSWLQGPWLLIITPSFALVTVNTVTESIREGNPDAFLPMGVFIVLAYFWYLRLSAVMRIRIRADGNIIFISRIRSMLIDIIQIREVRRFLFASKRSFVLKLDHGNILLLEPIKEIHSFFCHLKEINPAIRFNGIDVTQKSEESVKGRTHR